MANRYYTYQTQFHRSKAFRIVKNALISYDDIILPTPNCVNYVEWFRQIPKWAKLMYDRLVQQ